MVDFGSDFAGFSDVSPLFEQCGPDDPRIVPEALLRRLSTPRGALPDDPDYGYDVAAALRKPMTAEELAEIPGRIRAECLKDDRVELLTVKVEKVTEERFLVYLSGETGQGPFDLTASVADGAFREVNR